MCCSPMSSMPGLSDLKLPNWELWNICTDPTVTHPAAVSEAQQTAGHMQQDAKPVLHLAVAAEKYGAQRAARYRVQQQVIEQ